MDKYQTQGLQNKSYKSKSVYVWV